MLSLGLGLDATSVTSHVVVNSEADTLRRDTVAYWRWNVGFTGLIASSLVMPQTMVATKPTEIRKKMAMNTNAHCRGLPSLSP
ncbi:hypothetical protein PRUPE_8G108000 [Prunus persica]|uniref:Uncharacterized protein n=1 Tax=Prunus persica TaxID=3760 RepID=A0A251MW76_PRUPE|nr:hypothetical protein PRUPE_8G108000 [Prunus persica]